MNNIIGNKFGKWMVIEENGRNSNGDRLYKCRCECGYIKDYRKHDLINLISKQCKNCYTNELIKSKDEMIGKNFGFWSVVDKVKIINRNEWYYRCVCKCGTMKNISSWHLKSGKSTKCHRCRCKTHGMSKTDTFRIWTGILRRCLNPNFKHYKYYGGRGIKVCDSWLKFENFLYDMGHRPPNLQIDRKDNDGNYEPDNCHWVTAKENNTNRKIIIEKRRNNDLSAIRTSIL